MHSLANASRTGSGAYRTVNVKVPAFGRDLDKDEDPSALTAIDYVGMLRHASGSSLPARREYRDRDCSGIARTFLPLIQISPTLTFKALPGKVTRCPTHKH